MINTIRYHLSMTGCRIVQALLFFALYSEMPVFMLYLNLILNKMEQERWYTFDQIRDLGCPDAIARCLLDIACFPQSTVPALFEARPRLDMSVDMLAWQLGPSPTLTPDNAHFYEFRIAADLGEPREIPDPERAAVILAFA